MSLFKRNLFYGLGISLFLLLLSSVASYISIKNLINNSMLMRESNQTIFDINNTLSLVKDAETGQRGYLLTGDSRFIIPYNSAKQKIEEQLNSLKTQVAGTETQLRNFEKLSTAVKSRLQILDDNLKRGKSVTTEHLLSGKVLMDQILETIADMEREEQLILRMRTESLDRFSAFTPWLIITSALLAITITLFFFRKVLQDYDEKSNLTNELSLKNEESANRLTAIEEVSHKISAGNYDILSDERSKLNLGNVAEPLYNMAQSLKSSFNTLAEKQWLSSAVAELNDRMVGEKTIDILAKDVLDSITAHTKSAMAAIYLLSADGHLHLVGSYALSLSGKKILQKGEGISGQAFDAGKKITLDNIPEEATISFATGNTKPKSIVSLPIKRYNMPLGVVELGATHQYTPLQLEFLDAVSDNIGIAFYSAQSRIRLQELLEETQAQAEELQTQHTELENINAELEAQSQKLQASEEELRVQQEELLQSNQELEERSSMLEEKNALIEQRNFDIQQKSRELEQSTRYKSEFLANMSHELRTPLNSILLLSKLMVESEELDSQYVEYAQVMNSSGQGLLMLIDEILDLSKIEAGKMVLDIHDVQVQEIIKDMELMFKPMASQKNLALYVDYAPGIKPLLRTDKQRVEQVLKNLLSNAIKFTSQGSITLRVSNDETKNKVLFSVKDTGIGIVEDKQKMVFEAFQQADGSTQRKYGGTGLGLSISRELARLLGGKIKLESTEGKGSEFTLIIPVDAENASEMAEEKVELPEAPETKPTYSVSQNEETQRYLAQNIPQPVEDDRDNIADGDKVILIIEDDTDFARILMKYTRSKNYKCIVAVRGDVGIEMAQLYKPLAILLDIQLPVMDGWQVMEALKSNPETKPIPVHIMSSLKMKQESLLKGAVDFINKPFALEQMPTIFQKLEDALNKAPKKVLIVEENEYHAKALSYFLRAHGVDTDIAKNVTESIDALVKRDIDCVILDMAVPDKNAYDTLETIKQNKGLEQLPIVIFTGNNLSKGEESRIKKYADSIVVKTVNSYQRILDEAGLFLHLVEKNNKEKQNQNGNIEKLSVLRNILKDKTVLIADDDVRNIFSLTKALEIQGMKVIAAMDGREAMAALENYSEIDVVLMDMMMPEMDGYETIREIRASAKFRHLPVLAVTAKAMMGDREKCIAVGASDFISKPVDIDQLVSLLRVWLYDKF